MREPRRTRRQGCQRDEAPVPVHMLPRCCQLSMQSVPARWAEERDAKDLSQLCNGAVHLSLVGVCAACVHGQDMGQEATALWWESCNRLDSAAFSPILVQ